MSFWRPSVIKELLETMNRKSTSAAGIWASLLLAFLLSFFAPVQAFLTNLNDFSFDFYDMAGYLAVLLILSFCFLFLICPYSNPFGSRLLYRSPMQARYINITCFTQLSY